MVTAITAFLQIPKAHNDILHRNAAGCRVSSSPGRDLDGAITGKK
jgi:hypothetical protein